MTSRLSPLPIRVGIALTALITALASPHIASAETTEEPPGEPVEDGFARLVADAATHFRAGHYEQALGRYEQALRVAPPGADRATLEFNAASCLFELGRFPEAERRFVSAASLDEALAPLALLDAGMAAARAGRLEVAERHRLAAPVGDSEAEARRRELAELVRALEAERRAAQRRAAMTDAASAMSRADYAAVIRILSGVEPLMPEASREEQADVLFALGRASLELGRTARARGYLERARALAPDDPDQQYWSARATLAAGEEEEGSIALERSLALGLSGSRRADAERRLALLDPLPARGWSGWVGVGAGYDTNPLQSGLAETVVSGAQGSGGAGKGRRRSSEDPSSGSAFLTAGGELGHTLGLGRQWALQPYYALDWLGLLAPTVQGLSVQSHDLGPRLFFTPIRAIRLRAAVSAGYSLVGLDPMEPLSWQLRGEVRADWHVRSSRTRLQGAVTRVTGLSDYDFLSGTLTELLLSERLELGAVALEIRGQLRRNDIGAQRLEVSAETYPSCSACAGQTYVIPLGYFEYGARGALEVDVTERIMLGASASTAWRTYEDESYITAVPESAKLRSDRRVGVGAAAELALNEAGSLLIALHYDLLWSESNVALDPNDPAHALDYDDRNYVQHVIEAGFEAYF